MCDLANLILLLEMIKGIKHNFVNDKADEKEQKEKQSEQQEELLTADGILISTSGIDVLKMILFRKSIDGIKKSCFANFAEMIVRNFVKANTKEDIDKYILYCGIADVTDILSLSMLNNK